MVSSLLSNDTSLTDTTQRQKMGFVERLRFNYAPEVNIDEVEKDSELLKDSLKPKHHRKYARIWLPSEFASRDPVPVAAFEKVTGKGLVEDVSLKLNIDNALNKSGASEFYDSTTNIPSRGALVHNEYTMLAHFYFLKNLFSNVGKTRFYMDVDSGMKMSYISAFREEIAKGVSDGFMLKGAKEFTVDEKERRRMASLRSIARYAGTSVKALTDDALHATVRLMICDLLEYPTRIKGSPENWITHPLATMSEPERMMAAITPMEKYDKSHVANLYNRGSLNAVDRFFMKARRSVSMFERPMSSGANNRRVWYLYSAYRPDMYIKLGEIFRTYYNFCIKGSDKKTPAMRFGLAKGPVAVEKIIYYGKYE